MERDLDLQERLTPGTRIEVRRRFDSGWAAGFEVAEVMPAGYRVRRMSDGDVLPVEFDLDDVRRERKKGMWWY
jgi:hypothetical protein